MSDNIENAVETEEVTGVEETTETKSAPKVARMCKGTMPLPLVWFIKFVEDHTNLSQLAGKYFTTPGKISDIVKSRNQAYVVENVQWTEAEIESALEAIKINFTRGQDEDGNPLDPNNKRGTATTTLEDAAKSIEALNSVLEIQAKMGLEKWITLEEARALVPRKSTKSSKSKDATPEEAIEDDLTVAVDEAVDLDDIEL